MAVEPDDQRHIVGDDKLDAVFIVNMLFPERRQVHFHGVEEIAPFIRIVGSNAVACDGAGQREHGAALRVEGQRRWRDRRAGRRNLHIAVQIAQIVFNALALFVGQFPRGCAWKKVQPR